MLRGLCEFVGLPCEDELINAWAAMASCTKSVTKHVAGHAGTKAPASADGPASTDASWHAAAGRLGVTLFVLAVFAFAHLLVRDRQK